MNKLKVMKKNIEFLDNHPAVAIDNNFFNNNFCFWVDDYNDNTYQYYGECAFFKFDPKLIKDDDKRFAAYSRKHFEAYVGPSCRGDTFEDLINNIAIAVKKNYGSFTFDDFLTEAEKLNHNTESMFTPVKTSAKDVKNNPFLKDCTRFIRNSKYMDVSLGELNLRWWNWYRSTEHYKKNWQLND